MRQRLIFILGAITAVALAAGAAWAAIPSSVDSDSIIEVADAGSVTVVVDGSQLAIAEINPTAGWTYEIEVASGREVEADFRNGNRRIQFNAELEDGQVRARVRERVQVSDQTAPSTGDSTSSTIGESTSTTIGESTSSTVDDSTSTTIGDTTSSTVDDSTSTTIDDDNTTSTTIDDSTSTTVDDDDDAPSGAGSETYSVGGVATVSIAWADGRMSLVSVAVTDGWTIDKQEVRSDRIKIEFESDDNDARFEADFHDGSIRVETRVD